MNPTRDIWQHIGLALLIVALAVLPMRFAAAGMAEIGEPAPSELGAAPCHSMTGAMAGMDHAEPDEHCATVSCSACDNGAGCDNSCGSCVHAVSALPAPGLVMAPAVALYQAAPILPFHGITPPLSIRPPQARA